MRTAQFHQRRLAAGRRNGDAGRTGTILALLAVLLPVLLAVIGLVLDGGGLLNEYRFAQHAADAAASAAARSLQEGATVDEATAVAEQYVLEHNGLSEAEVTVSIPPVSGPLTGDSRSVEVEVHQPASAHFLNFLDSHAPSVRTRAVARYEPATAGAALVVLDPDPPPLALPLISPLLPPLPSLLGGLEVIGTSQIRVDGAILVNSTWGGIDEKGNLAGEAPGPPWGVAAPSLIPQIVQARDIRVVGGVDSRWNYGPFSAGDPNPLRANRLPVPDPLSTLPVPTTASDPANVSSVLRGSVNHAGIPLLSPPLTLQPGIYDYIRIVSGAVIFQPGIYIIRGGDLAGIALNIIGGQVTADGVLFYITDSAGYSAGTGFPDAADGETVPPPPSVPSLVPSVVITALLPGSRYRGLNDPSSPFHGMLIYQRRTDRRPVAIINGLLLGGDHLGGTIYAKWGHVLLAGSRFGDTRVVAGTLRLIALLPSTIAPSALLPPAEDVFLVE